MLAVLVSWMSVPVAFLDVAGIAQAWMHSLHQQMLVLFVHLMSLLLPVQAVPSR